MKNKCLSRNSFGRTILFCPILWALIFFEVSFTWSWIHGINPLLFGMPENCYCWVTSWWFDRPEWFKKKLMICPEYGSVHGHQVFFTLRGEECNRFCIQFISCYCLATAAHIYLHLYALICYKTSFCWRVTKLYSIRKWCPPLLDKHSAVHHY